MKMKKWLALIMIVAILLGMNLTAYSESSEPTQTGILDPLLPILKCNFYPTWHTTLGEVKKVKNVMVMEDSFLAGIEINGESGILMGNYVEGNDWIDHLLLSGEKSLEDVRTILEDSEFLLYQEKGLLPGSVNYYMVDGSVWKLSTPKGGFLIDIEHSEDISEADAAAGDTEIPQNNKMKPVGAIGLSFTGNRYNAGLWNVPVLNPDTEILNCTEFTLCFSYTHVDSKELGEQRVFVSIDQKNGAWLDCGTINVPEAEKVYRKTITFEKPRTVGGIAVLSKTATTSSFGVNAWIEDVKTK